jgi:hypothetical protein
VADPAGEERARAILAAAKARGRDNAGEDSGRGRNAEVSRAAARLILRRPHLSLVADLEKELAARLEADGDAPGALEVLALCGADFPGSGLEGDLEEKAMAASREPEAVAEGLAAVLAARGKGPLGKLWWAPAEEGFLVEGAPGSEPSEQLLAISRGKLRFYGKDGRLLHERELRDYPDVSEIKASLQSHIEEPALGRWKGGELLLFTPAGYYSFNFSAPGAEGAAAKPKDSKLRWIRSLPHPLLGINTRSEFIGFGGGMDLPSDQNFFPEVVFDSSGIPLTVLPDGTLFALDLRTGKYSWRREGEGGRASSPPLIRGPWVCLETNAPAGIRLCRLPSAPQSPSSKSAGKSVRRFIAGPEQGALSAALLAGGLAAAFSGATLEVREAEGDRVLWRKEPASLTLAGTTPTEVWLSQPDGKLTAHSIRSGREKRSVDLPRGTMVVDKFHDPGTGGSAPAGGIGKEARDPATILVLSRSYATARGYRYGRTQTGTDLFLVRLDSRWQKTWEKQIARGSVTFAGGRHLLPDGRFVLLFNAEVEPEKWYTRAVIVDPYSGAHEDLASVEVESKGTGQAPRLAVLKEGLALGNADGFGWFAPKAEGESKAAPEPKVKGPEARDDKKKEAEY